MAFSSWERHLLEVTIGLYVIHIWWLLILGNFENPIKRSHKDNQLIPCLGICARKVEAPNRVLFYRRRFSGFTVKFPVVAKHNPTVLTDYF